MFFAQLALCPLVKRGSEQRLHLPINKHKDITLHAVQSNNCSGDFVLTVLSGQPFGFAFHLAFTVCDEFEYLSVALPGWWSLCTNKKWNRGGLWCTGAHLSDSPDKWTVGRLDMGREWQEREQDREGEREWEGPRQAALALFTTKSHCLMWSRSRLQSSRSHRMCSG